ncbi:MAG: adenine deaminase [Clostridia bacterium]|nr:adenine deaminase [Clostridia bacterium]
MRLSGNIVDLIREKIFKGTVVIRDGKIAAIEPGDVTGEHYILPGFIDAHVHIESSMLIPSEFARLAVVHGTVATVSDPHEIANVLGMAGVNYMIENGKQVPFKFFFGAPSCVPATGFESSGAVIDAQQLDKLLSQPDIYYLSEMMNYPGVLYNDAEVMAKLAAARKHNKPVDGHAPGLKGEEARKYIEAGITTDHECFSMEEALDKIKYGMKIQIREGSAARNFEALVPLLADHADKVLFCSDDKHPDDLVKGHINQLVRRAVAAGYPAMKVLRSCILNPIHHYALQVGLLRPGDDADLIVVKDLKDFDVLKTYIRGKLVAENGKTLIGSVDADKPNLFVADEITPEQLAVEASGNTMRVIKVIAGELITEEMLVNPKTESNRVVADLDRDILKLVVLNRYKKAAPAIGFIHNLGFRNGAIASTVAHDSHNIIATGTSDQEISRAINLLIASKGGIVLVNGEQEHLLPLPVAGLMSADDGYKTAAGYEKINHLTRQLGTELEAPFMALSFMALLVIPQLKLSDAGLFDGTKFEFTNLFVEQ